MKRNVFAAAVAALTLATAGAAAAQDFRHGDRRGEITVRDHGRQFTIDRRDRLYHRVQESPYRFRPGLTYVYTNDCRRDGQCRVLVYAPHRRGPVHSLHAPRLRGHDGWNDRRGGRRDWRD